MLLVSCCKGSCLLLELERNSTGKAMLVLSAFKFLNLKFQNPDSRNHQTV